MMTHLYLAEGESGEHSDWSHWTVGVYTTRGKAKEACRMSIQQTEPLRWNYDAKGQMSTAAYRFSTWEKGSLSIRRIKVDSLLV